MGQLMGTSVCITASDDANEAAQVIYDSIMNGTNIACSFRYFLYTFDIYIYIILFLAMPIK